MTTPAPSPLPWSIRPCSEHIGLTGKICDCIRDASGKVVTDQQIMERINELHDEKAKLVEALVKAKYVMGGMTTYKAEDHAGIIEALDQIDQALSLARRKP